MQCCSCKLYGVSPLIYTVGRKFEIEKNDMQRFGKLSERTGRWRRKWQTTVEEKKKDDVTAVKQGTEESEENKREVCREKLFFGLIL